jgi:hypothetical protein
MVKKLQMKSRKISKKTTRKNRKSFRKNKGGGCGCNKTLISMKGGNSSNASFDGTLSKDYYYPYKDEGGNPNTPALLTNTRNLPNITGGKKSRRYRKIKGGSWSLLGDAYSNNPLASFLTMDGSIRSANLYSGNSQINPSISDQPVIRGFNNTNPPLA